MKKVNDTHKRIILHQITEHVINVSNRTLVKIDALDVVTFESLHEIKHAFYDTLNSFSDGCEIVLDTIVDVNDLQSQLESIIITAKDMIDAYIRFKLL